MLGFIKKVLILVMSIPLISGCCLLLKNQECAARIVIVDKDYMTFLYKIKVGKCTGTYQRILKFVYLMLLKILV